MICLQWNNPHEGVELIKSQQNIYYRGCDASCLEISGSLNSRESFYCRFISSATEGFNTRVDQLLLEHFFLKIQWRCFSNENSEDLIRISKLWKILLVSVRGQFSRSAVCISLETFSVWGNIRSVQSDTFGSSKIWFILKMIWSGGWQKVEVQNIWSYGQCAWCLVNIVNVRFLSREEMSGF